jgi:O-6-methylguanine DNA methyltransferase
MRVTRHPYEVEGWGVGEVWACGTTLVQHELASEALAQEAAHAAAASAEQGPRGGAAHSPAPPKGGTRRPARTLPPDPSRDDAAFVAELCRRVAEHLRGVETSYDDVELDLDWATPLQCELVAAARAVPWGEVVSYGELAALAGRPGAARAAGTFCAENRFALVIPCHRVVAANGIGGYGPSGVGLKRRLLALEGVHL